MFWELMDLNEKKFMINNVNSLEKNKLIQNKLGNNKENKLLFVLLNMYYKI
jgi:hypothetical protein